MTTCHCILCQLPDYYVCDVLEDAKAELAAWKARRCDGCAHSEFAVAGINCTKWNRYFDYGHACNAWTASLTDWADLRGVRGVHLESATVLRCPDCDGTGMGDEEQGWWWRGCLEPGSVPPCESCGGTGRTDTEAAS